MAQRSAIDALGHRQVADNRGRVVDEGLADVVAVDNPLRRQVLGLGSDVGELDTVVFDFVGPAVFALDRDRSVCLLYTSPSPRDS